MKLYVQISDVDEPDGKGVAYSDATFYRSDLGLALDEFVARYVKPAFVHAKQQLEDLEVKPCTEA